MDGQKVTALIDWGAQVTSISSGFCKLLTLEVHPLGQLLELEGARGSAILYLGYIEVNLQIPGIKGYNEDVLLPVIQTTTYSEEVLVMVSSKIIDWVMGMKTKGELAGATVTWEQAHFGAVLSGLLQLPHTDSKEDRGVGKEGTPSPSSDATVSRGFCWDEVQGPSIPLRRLLFPCLGLLISMAIQVSRETACGFTCLLSKVPAKAIVGKITPANQVPLVVLLMEASGGSTHGPQKGWILEALNLQGLEEWPEEEQIQARELLLKWEHLFACSDLNLDKTSLIKHQFKLTDMMPFNVHY